MSAEALAIEARRRGCPLLAVSTPDTMATEAAIQAEVAAQPPQQQGACLSWTLALGLQPLNSMGEAVISAAAQPEGGGALASLMGGGGPPGVGDVCGACRFIMDLPEWSVVYLHGAHRHTDNPAFVSWLTKIRQEFRVNNRLLVLLGPSFSLPPEVVGDIIAHRVARPTLSELVEMVKGEADKQELAISDDDVHSAARRLRGCTAFQVEQNLAMSLVRRNGHTAVDLQLLLRHQQELIQSTPGLALIEGAPDIAPMGLDNVLRFMDLVSRGQKKRPCLYVLLDEINDAVAGAAGDTSGVSQEFQAELLTHFSMHRWTGILAVGIPGTGKSLLISYLMKKHGIPGLICSINDCKAGLVGQSGANLRHMLSVLYGLGGQEVFFIATCNDTGNLAPQMKARFEYGTWFFDAPSPEALSGIWLAHKKLYGLPEDMPHPTTDGWEEDVVGRDCSALCRVAAQTGITLEEATAFVAPQRVRDPLVFTKARELAKGRFISAAAPGVYEGPKKRTRRRVSL